MINNAGLMPLSPLEMERFDEWNQAIDVNIKGVLWGIAAALPHFKAQRSGQFINVSSVAGTRSAPAAPSFSPPFRRHGSLSRCISAEGSNARRLPAVHCSRKQEERCR